MIFEQQKKGPASVVGIAGPRQSTEFTLPKYVSEQIPRTFREIFL